MPRNAAKAVSDIQAYKKHTVALPHLLPFFFLRTVIYILFTLALLSCRSGEHAAQKATGNRQGSSVSLSQTSSTGGRGKRTATAGQEKAVPAHTLSYEEERQFNRLFLEAIRQKEADHTGAEYELLAKALQINPLAPEALYEMGMIKLTQSSYSDTLSRAAGDSLLRKAVTLDPDNLYFKETLATYQANAAQYREAIELYEEIADKHETEETLSTLVWLYKTSGDYAGAVRTIERMERLLGKSESLSIEKFQTFLAMNDTEHAYQAIEELCAEYPYDLRYRVLLADLYDKHGYHEQALDIYRDVLTAEPDNSYAQISLLAYYKAAGADSLYLDLLNRMVLNPHTQSGAQFEAMKAYMLDDLRQEGSNPAPVLKLFNKVLAQPQGSSDIAELKAVYVQLKGLPDDSLKAAYNKVLEIEPDNTSYRMSLMSLQLKQSDYKAVLQTSREGILYDPTIPAFYHGAGIALYFQGDNKQAIEQLQRGTEHIEENADSSEVSDIYALLGDILHENGRNEEAFQSFERALEYNPDNALCLNNYAYFLALTGKNLDKAERMSRHCIELETDNATYFDTYAWILYKQRKYREALYYSEEALQLADNTSESATIYENAGDICYRNKAYAQALAHWRKALSLTNDKKARTRIARKVRLKRI